MFFEDQQHAGGLGHRAIPALMDAVCEAASRGAANREKNVKQLATSIRLAIPLAAFAPASSADLTINITEVGSDVVIAGTGALDLSAWNNLGDIGGDFTARIQGGSIALGPDVFNSDFWAAPVSFSGPANITADSTAPTSVSGDSIWIDWTSDAIYLPQGFVSGSTVSVMDTYAGETYASMGLVAGESYVWTWDILDGGTEVLTINVPAPTTAASLGLAAFAATRRRR